MFEIIICNFIQNIYETYNNIYGCFPKVLQILIQTFNHKRTTDIKVLPKEKHCIKFGILFGILYDYDTGDKKTNVYMKA